LPTGHRFSEECNEATKLGSDVAHLCPKKVERVSYKDEDAPEEADREAGVQPIKYK